MLENIDALIFDLDGTLVDSMWIWRDIDVEYLKRYNITTPANIQLEVEGMSFTETALFFKEKFAIPDDAETIKSDWNKLAVKKYMTEVPMKPGAVDFLEFALLKGFKMGIATSNSIELVNQITNVHGLDKYFPVIKTSCEAKKGKPAPDIYLLVAETLKVKPERCLVFEDIVPGIIAGKSAGMKVCAVDDINSQATLAEKKRLADYYIYHYDEILRD
ncbi:MAG: HAD family phosphatase [Lachnospiraceae bacterium]|nr:HAD family phosphatase [Lachnospiraceae bacterium]